MNVPKKIETKLVSNWRKAWRMFSVQAMTLALIVQSAWAVLDADLRASLPVPWVRGITIALLVLGIAGRLVSQPKTGE